MNGETITILSDINSNLARIAETLEALAAGGLNTAQQPARMSPATVEALHYAAHIVPEPREPGEIGMVRVRSYRVRAALNGGRKMLSLFAVGAQYQKFPFIELCEGDWGDPVKMPPELFDRELQVGDEAQVRGRIVYKVSAKQNDKGNYYKDILTLEVAREGETLPPLVPGNGNAPAQAFPAGAPPKQNGNDGKGWNVRVVGTVKDALGFADGKAAIKAMREAGLEPGISAEDAIAALQKSSASLTERIKDATRPWPADLLAEVLRHNAKKKAEKGETGKPSNGKRGVMVGKLEALFEGDKDERAAARRSVLRNVFGVDSSNQMDLSQVEAVLCWLDGNGTKEELVKETRAVVDAAPGAGGEEGEEGSELDDFLGPKQPVRERFDGEGGDGQGAGARP